jgi:hypothetical protein
MRSFATRLRWQILPDCDLLRQLTRMFTLAIFRSVREGAPV